MTFDFIEMACIVTFSYTKIRVLFEGISPAEAIMELMGRELTDEHPV